MTPPSRLPTLFVGAALLLSLAQTLDAQESGFSHADWNEVLETFVDPQGLVDYRGLAKNPTALKRYIAQIESQGPTTSPSLFATRNDRLAYYINAYNAQVFASVLDRGAETQSVWSGGLISGYSFFVRRKVVVDGRKMSLKKLEDDLIREQFEDPRIHAALNCASIGCPRLPRSPFEGSRLDAQLDEAMQEFVSSAQHVLVDTVAGEVSISKIFDWFEGDFLDWEKRRGERKPRILAHLNRFRADDEQLPLDFEVDYLEYDKGLNRQ